MMKRIFKIWAVVIAVIFSGAVQSYGACVPYVGDDYKCLTADTNPIAKVGSTRENIDGSLAQFIKNSSNVWVQTNSPAGSGSGNVIGPTSASDNAIVRFDGTTGTLIQNSAVSVSDTGDITAGKYNTVAISGSATPILAVTGTAAITNVNSGDNATNSNYANDYRAANFVAGTNYEAALGNPTVSGYVLSKSTSGVVTWVESGGGGGGDGTVTSVTAGNGLTQSGTSTINPTLNVVSAAGTAGSVGTLTVTADAVGVTLGTTSTTAAAGNDSRLSDVRSPTAHASTHVTGGSDVIAAAVSAGNSGLMTGADKADFDYVRGSEIDRLCSGLVSGGSISVHAGNQTVDVSSGVGYVNDHTGVAGSYKKITFGPFTNQSPAGNGDNFVQINADGTLHISSTRQDLASHVYVGHFFVQTPYVLSVFNVPEWTGHFQGRINDFMTHAMHAVVSDGLTVSEQATPLKLTIAAGTYYARLGAFSFVSPITSFTKIYNAGGVWTQDSASPDYVNVTQWNDAASGLTTMTTGYWKKDLVLVTDSGSVFFVFGQAEYATSDLALLGAYPVIPESISDDSAFVAAIISQKGDSTIAARIRDIRPVFARIFGYGTTAGGAVIDHGSLAGLADDDHTQYFNQTRGDARYLQPGATFNLGTTGLALNRASGATALTGITSIDGSAATLTTSRSIQGAAFNGSADINPINGTGFVKSAGTTLSYDNSSYLTTAGNAASATKSSNLTGGNTTTLLGAIPYQSGVDTTSILSPNTTAAKQFLTQTGTGANGAAPAWGALASGDIPANAANTTGSAAKWTTARALAGNSVDGSAAVTFANKFVVQGTTDTGLTGAQFLGALGTGIVKNTTTTGVLSIATGADLPAMSATVGGAVPTPPNNTTTFLRGDGTFATPAGSGDMVLASVQTVTGAKTFNDTKLLLQNVAGTFNGSFTNTNTANRVYTLKDSAGTIAFTSDITGTNSGTNTGDVTLATNSGLAFTSGQTLLALGTPTSITSGGSNSVTTNTHTHAITAGLGFIGNGSAQYQLPVTGSTPFTPVWTTATGTGSPVLATSPALVTPALGTPASGNFSTGTFTWPTFNQDTTGTAAKATAVTVTSDNTATTYYPHFGTAAGTAKSVLVDDTTTPMTYVPSTGTLSASNFSGVHSAGSIASAVTATTQTAGNNSTLVATTAYTDNAASGKEPALGNPGTNGFVLSSTTGGTRSWVVQGGGSMIYPGSGVAVSTGSAWGTSLNITGISDSTSTTSSTSAASSTAVKASYDLANGKETALGNPGTNGYVLSSTTTGTRSWIAPGSGGGSGDVVGPASATDNTVALFDGTTGKLLKDAGPVVTDLARESQSNTFTGLQTMGTLVATAGQGFSNMVVYTTGTSATWTLPAALQVTGAKWSVTACGGGGGGGGSNTTAGMTGGGGASAGCGKKIFTYIAAQNSATYSIGALGSAGATNAAGGTGGATTFIYNSVTYTASGGVGGPSGGTAAAGAAGGAVSGWDLNIPGQAGTPSGTMASTNNLQGYGGNTPFGLGFGGQEPFTAAGAVGIAGTGYGSGGSGGKSGTGTTARTGGAGTAGIIEIDY